MLLHGTGVVIPHFWGINLWLARFDLYLHKDYTHGYTNHIYTISKICWWCVSDYSFWNSVLAIYTLSMLHPFPHILCIELSARSQSNPGSVYGPIISSTCGTWSSLHVSVLPCALLLLHSHSTGTSANHCPQASVIVVSLVSSSSMPWPSRCTPTARQKQVVREKSKRGLFFEKWQKQVIFSRSDKSKLFFREVTEANYVFEKWQKQVFFEKWQNQVVFDKSKFFFREVTKPSCVWQKQVIFSRSDKSKLCLTKASLVWQKLSLRWQKHSFAPLLVTKAQFSHIYTSNS